MVQLPLATKGRRDAAARFVTSSLLGFWAAAMRGRGAVPAVRRAYSERAGERQEMRDSPGCAENDRNPSAYGLPDPSLASSAAMRAFKASFSSRARRAISLTAS